MLIGLGVNITCIDLGFTRSKVKVTRVLFVKNGFYFFLKTIYPRSFRFYMLIGLDGDMTLLDIELIRSKVKFRRITFVKNDSTHYIKNCLSQSFHILHANWSWLGLDPY